MITLPAHLDSTGEYIDQYEEYLIAEDGTFVPMDVDAIKEFLLNEYCSDEIDTTEKYLDVVKEEFKQVAYAEFNDANCDYDWFAKDFNLDHYAYYIL